MEKDRLSTEIVKQQRLKQKLYEQMVRLVCESNAVYKRAEQNIFPKPYPFK